MLATQLQKLLFRGLRQPPARLVFMACFAVSGSILFQLIAVSSRQHFICIFLNFFNTMHYGAVNGQICL